MAEDKIYTLKELQKKLTEKERVFCHQYIIDWNGARAARVAGYSVDSAADIAYQNSIKLHIKQYIDFIKDDIEKETGITKIRQLNELAKIAYSNIVHVHDNWIELTDWEHIKQNNPDVLSAVESIDTKTETKTYNKGEDSETDVEIKYVKIKLHSKTTAIAEINKMQGYHATQRLDLGSSDGSMSPKAADLSKLTKKTLKQMENDLDAK